MNWFDHNAWRIYLWAVSFLVGMIVLAFIVIFIRGLVG